MRIKYIFIGIAAGVLLTSAVVVLAGNLDSPAAPDADASKSYNLEDIYNRLATGAAGERSAFTEPSAGPGSTGHTLDAVMDKAPAVDATDGATQTHVLVGKTFWGLTSGEWGTRTGTMPDNGTVTIVPTTTNQTIAAGYHNGSGYVEGDTNLLAGNIIAGMSIFGVVGTANPTFVPKTGQTTSHEDYDDGYYSETVGVAWPVPRFITGTTGVVTDTLTGLIWLENANCPNATRNWTTALGDVAQLNTNGTMNGHGCGDTSNGGSHQTDWRLPNVRELYSLIHSGRANSATWLQTQGFTGVQSNAYWSGTTCASNTSSAWYVYLDGGRVGGGGKTSALYVWPVRGGQ